jgi:arylsulfatase A-like enzyme/Tfp pilus assembly protein PilF
MARRLALSIALLAGAGSAAVWFLARPPRTEAAARQRLTARRPAPEDLNLVVVTIDTLRADRLGCYGFGRIQTPTIDDIAREGVLFEQATSTVPLTFPSHASIFTGRIPPHHGVRDNGGFFLGDEQTTLAERLKQAGFATGAFVGAWVLESKWGLAQGFDTYSDRFDLSKYRVISLGTVQKKGDEVMDDTLAWLESVRARRFFAWVHLYDPHAPYEPPEPYLSRYRGEPYLGEIAYTDHVVGRLMGFLRDRGLLARTLLIVTADHGESLGEHGEAAHGYFIYGSTTHVPLIIRTPWNDHGRVSGQVSSVDIFPTVLDLLGLQPQDGIDGRSLARQVLAPRLAVQHSAYSESFFPRFHYGWQQLRGLRDGKRFFVEAPQPELYDLQRDPGEAENRYRPDAADELRRALRELVGAASGGRPERQKLDPDTLERLAALGYVGNAAPADSDVVLPDPKTKLDIFKMMGEAQAQAREGRLTDAIATMRGALAEDAQVVDAHVTLGQWLGRTGDHAAARAELERAVALRADDEYAELSLAQELRSCGDAAGAIAAFRAALAVDARSPQIWYQLATLYLDLGKVDAAEATLHQALAANPKMGAAYNSLGVIAFWHGRAAEAERLVRLALELEPRLRTARFNLGRLLEARGALSDAEAAYRQELESYPDSGKAHFNVAQLRRQQGDREGYLRELRSGVEQATDFGPCYFFLAREELEAGRLEAASDLARRGLERDAASAIAPLGHYVLADAYDRQGEHAKADSELRAARRLEATLKRNPPNVL